MAFLKHFRTVRYRVPDPMRPGHLVFSERLEHSGAQVISHAGEEFTADVDGWFDLPEHVVQYLHNFPGWRSPDEVDEEVRVGRLPKDSADALPQHPAAAPTAPAAPVKRGPGRPPKNPAE